MFAHIGCCQLCDLYFNIVVIHNNSYASLRGEWDMSEPGGGIFFFSVAENIFVSLTGYNWTKEKLIDSHLLNGSIYKLSSPSSGSNLAKKYSPLSSLLS